VVRYRKCQKILSPDNFCVCRWFRFSTWKPNLTFVLCNNFPFVLSDMRNGGEKSLVPWRPDAGFSRYPRERRRQGLCERDDWLEQKIFGCERQVTSQPLNRTRVSLMPYLISVRNKNPQPYSVALREIDSSPCSVLPHDVNRLVLENWNKIETFCTYTYLYIFSSFGWTLSRHTGKRLVIVKNLNSMTSRFRLLHSISCDLPSLYEFN
jgi:hypothetical protein